MLSKLNTKSFLAHFSYIFSCHFIRLPTKKTRTLKHHSYCAKIFQQISLKSGQSSAKRWKKFFTNFHSSLEGVCEKGISQVEINDLFTCLILKDCFFNHDS